MLGFQQQTNYVPRTFDGSLDGRALDYALGLSLLTGMVFSLAPSRQASTPDFVAALKEDRPGLGRRARRLNLRNLLAVTQVALSLVVLICAGLCVKSLRARRAALRPDLATATWLTCTENRLFCKPPAGRRTSAASTPRVSASSSNASARSPTLLW